MACCNVFSCVLVDFTNPIYIVNDGIPKMVGSASPIVVRGWAILSLKTEHPPQTCNESDVDFERIMPSVFVRCGEIVSSRPYL